MIFSFKNSSENDMTIFIEPTIDEFLLSPESIFKIDVTLAKLQDEFEYDFYSDIVVIWMPNKSKAKFSIDGKKVDSIYEEFG